MIKMRFHVLGQSFAPTTKLYSFEGFSNKVRLFCKMMTELGHTVYHYGIEGSDPICTENIDVVSRDTWEKEHLSYDYTKTGFSHFSETKSQDEFNFNAIIQIQKRKQENDFLCFSFGFPQRPIYNAHKDLISTEIGVGFDGSFTYHRVFESYAWMHTVYGKEDILPNFYDAVIPNFFDLDDYIFSEEKDDYFLFIGRMEPLKGLEIALKSAEYAGYKLITAGIGEPHITSPNLTHIGVVDFENRAKLMSRAKATFIPTNYSEPFGSTVIESLLCGTPVITTDFGSFPENVIHGRVGYRCRTMEQFFWAAKNINNIKPIDCRNYAINNFSISRISEMYKEYFEALYKLKTNKLDILNRKNINWLNRYIPDVRQIKDDNRPILCFFIGYLDNINNYTTLNKLAEKLTEKYRVYMFGTEIFESKNKNNVEFFNFNKFEEFQKNNKIDIIIIYEYINFFMYFEIKDSKIFIFAENQIMPYYESREILNNGYGLIKNIINKIEYIITTSDSKKEYFKSYYNINNVCTLDKNEEKWYELFE